MVWPLLFQAIARQKSKFEIPMGCVNTNMPLKIRTCGKSSDPFSVKTFVILLFVFYFNETANSLDGNFLMSIKCHTDQTNVIEVQRRVWTNWKGCTYVEWIAIYALVYFKFKWPRCRRPLDHKGRLKGSRRLGTWGQF